MKRINDLFFFLNKLDFICYLEGNDDEKTFSFIERVVIFEFEEFNSEKSKNKLNIVDGFVDFFDNFNSGPSGYW